MTPIDFLVGERSTASAWGLRTAPLKNQKGRGFHYSPLLKTARCGDLALPAKQGYGSFVAFLAYCVQATLRRWLRDLAPGLTPRAVLDKFRAVQMIDVHLPTTDNREVILSRYTQLEKDLQLLLNQLKLQIARAATSKNQVRRNAGQLNLVVKTF